MATILKTKTNKKIAVDDQGFLRDLNMWDEDVAKVLAKKEGIEHLGYDKLLIIRTLRAHYKKFQSFPILGKICRQAGAKRKDCVSEEFSDPMKAWKIAGLPKPANVFFTSFDGKKYIPNPFY